MTTELSSNPTLAEDFFEHHRLVIDPGQRPMRIDKFLMDRLPHTTRNRIQLAIKNGFIKVNGNQIKASYQVKPDQLIQVVLPHPPCCRELLPENIALNIVYEDPYILVVNKAAGMVVHPGHNNWTGTLANALVYHFNNLPTISHKERRPGLVHRIDKDTSGLLVVAKTEEGIIGLSKQFHEHSIERTYYALVWGEPDPAIGTIVINLGRSLRDRRVVTTYADPEQGKRAITHYEVVKKLGYVSLVKCKLATGRTHQIRAHMKYLGHPIFSDETYGGRRLVKGQQFPKYKAFVENCFQLMPRQALHAYSLGFIHPITQKYIYFEAALPVDFKAVLEKWENYVKSYLDVNLA
jgi:23S rRNA pseudouridine1911/1915/1917 synthase